MSKDTEWVDASNDELLIQSVTYSERISFYLSQGDLLSASYCYNAWGNWCFENGLYDFTLKCFTEVLNIAKLYPTAPHLMIAAIRDINDYHSLLSSIGTTLVLDEIIESSYLAAIADVETLYPNGNRDFAALLTHTALMYRDSANNQTSLDYLKKALLMSFELEYQQGIASACSHIGALHVKRGQPKEALEYFEQAARIFASERDYDQKSLSIALAHLAHVHFSLGNQADCEKNFKATLTLMESIYSGPHPEHAKTLIAFGSILIHYDKPQQSLDYLLPALKIRQALPLNDDAEALMMMRKLGEAYLQLAYKVQDKFDQYLQTSLKYLEPALGMMESLYPEGLANIASMSHKIGVIYNKLKQNDICVPHMEKALKIRQELHVEPHPDMAASLVDISTVYAHLGRYHQSLACLLKARVIQDKLPDVPVATIAVTLAEMGIVYTKLSKYNQSVKSLQAALEVYCGAEQLNYREITSVVDNLKTLYIAISACSETISNENRQQLLVSLLPKLKAHCRDSNLGSMLNELEKVAQVANSLETVLKYRQMYKDNCYSHIEQHIEICVQKDPKAKKPGAKTECVFPKSDYDELDITDFLKVKFPSKYIKITVSENNISCLIPSHLIVNQAQSSRGR